MCSRKEKEKEKKQDVNKDIRIMTTSLEFLSFKLFLKFTSSGL